MDIQNMERLLQNHYDIHIQKIELFRESVNSNCTYTVYGADKKYFLKAVNNLASFEMQTALHSIDIQLYLLQSGVPAVPIVFTKDGLPCVYREKQDEKYMYILYEFIEGIEPRAW